MTPAPKMDLLENWRLRMVLPQVRGRLLDIGCGYNNLVRRYAGAGVGVDVYPWQGVDVLVATPQTLPFPAASFDSVTIIAALNHIPDRAETLREARRILRPDGRLLLTMIGPLTGILAHLLFHHDEDVRGGFTPGELQGMTRQHVRQLLTDAGFAVQREIHFQVGLNTLFLAVPD